MDTAVKPAPKTPKPDWVRRFAYRAMLYEHELDTDSAFMVASGQFDDAYDLEPEAAAEIYASSRPGSQKLADAVFS